MFVPPRMVYEPSASTHLTPSQRRRKDAAMKFKANKAKAKKEFWAKFKASHS